MNLKALFSRFAADESGAVTVDWVVLAAGVVGLAVVVGAAVTGGVDAAATKITDGMAATPWTETE